jgi:hypothetical protein
VNRDSTIHEGRTWGGGGGGQEGEWGQAGEGGEGGEQLTYCM